jgi:hypothetical protein
MVLEIDMSVARLFGRGNPAENLPKRLDLDSLDPGQNLAFAHAFPFVEAGLPTVEAYEALLVHCGLTKGLLETVKIPSSIHETVVTVLHVGSRYHYL